MADLIRKMQEGHTVEDLDTVIDEVYEARGEYDSLDERLDDMEGGAPTPSTSIPAMDGTGSAGTSNQYARADHVHPSDTSKQNALSSTQLAAVNSGITAEGVAQIETNKNNILMLETMNGAKNLMHYDSIDDTRTTGTIIATLNSDMTITINGTSGNTPAVIGFVFSLKSGEYWLNGCPTDGSFETYSTDIRNQIYGSITYGRDTGSGGTVNISDDGNYAYNIRIAANTTINNIMFKPMLIPRDIKNAGFTNYQPYAMSNAELTAAIQAIQAQLANQ